MAGSQADLQELLSRLREDHKAVTHGFTNRLMHWNSLGWYRNSTFTQYLVVELASTNYKIIWRLSEAVMPECLGWQC